MTDRRRLAGEAGWDRACQCLVAQARYAVEAGVDVLQIREREVEARDLARLCREVVAIARGSRCRVVVNDRLDVALACGADGVHLRGDSIPPSIVRAVTPPGFLIGRSVHSEEEAAALSGVDYLIAGTVWATDSKPGVPLLGPEGLASITRRVQVPVLAIGGVSLERLAAASAAGAAGVAAIGLFLGDQAELGCRAVTLSETVQTARRRFDTPGGAS